MELSESMAEKLVAVGPSSPGDVWIVALVKPNGERIELCVEENSGIAENKGKRLREFLASLIDQVRGEQKP